jgi:hypothetical protein
MAARAGRGEGGAGLPFIKKILCISNNSALRRPFGTARDHPMNIAMNLEKWEN